MNRVQEKDDKRRTKEFAIEAARLLADRHCDDVRLLDVRGAMRSRALARPGEDPAIRGVKQNVVDHYEAQLLRFGASARGMDWKDEASQRLRFDVLCDVCDLRGKSVHDVGSGAGHLLDYLVGIARLPEAAGKIYDAGGPEVLTYEQLMRQYGELTGHDFWILKFP